MELDGWVRSFLISILLYMQVSGHFYTSAALYRGHTLRYPPYRRFGGPGSRSRRSGEDKNQLPRQGIPDRLAPN